MLNVLKNEFEIVENSENPEYVIVGYDAIIDIKRYWVTHRQLIKYKDAIAIFYTGESVFPDFNLFDYIVSRDDISFGDRFIRFLYNIDWNDNSTKIKTYDEAKELLYQKKYFCNFLYSHGNGHIMRDIMFDKLSEYKFVHSLGKYRKNADIEVGSRDSSSWFGCGIEVKNKFKFSISAENSLYKDGTTEKIYTSFLANTVPIYFGDENVYKYFNKEAFVNYHDYNNIDSLVKRVKEIDSNDELWIEMIMKPFRTDSQVQYLKSEWNKSSEMFLNIFRQDIRDAKRKPIGLIVNYYYSVIKNNARIAEKSDTLINKIVWFIPIKKWRNAIRKKFL